MNNKDAGTLGLDFLVSNVRADYKRRKVTITLETSLTSSDALGILLWSARNETWIHGSFSKLQMDLPDFDKLQNAADQLGDEISATLT